MARYILLLNLGSGGNERGLDAAEVCRIVESRFAGRGHTVESRCFPPVRIDREFERAVAGRPDGILVAGGDGTVSAAAGFLGGTGITLGILPMGTFNLAARDLGVPLDLEEAAEFLASAETRDIDVLDVAGHRCLCTTLLGFYPAYASMFERRDHDGKWWKKALRVIVTVPRCFRRAESLRLEWTGPDIPPARAKTKFCAFVPGHYKSEPGLMPERAGFDAGTLTAYICTQHKPAEAVRGLIDFLRGAQDDNPEVIVFQCRELTIRRARRKRATMMLDGEILRVEFPLTMKILPGDLRVLARPDPPGSPAEP